MAYYYGNLLGRRHAYNERDVVFARDSFPSRYFLDLLKVSGYGAMKDKRGISYVITPLVTMSRFFTQKLSQFHRFKMGAKYFAEVI